MIRADVVVVVVFAAVDGVEPVCPASSWAALVASSDVTSELFACRSRRLSSGRSQRFRRRVRLRDCGVSLPRCWCTPFVRAVVVRRVGVVDVVGVVAVADGCVGVFRPELCGAKLSASVAARLGRGAPVVVVVVVDVVGVVRVVVVVVVVGALCLIRLVVVGFDVVFSASSCGGSRLRRS